MKFQVHTLERLDFDYPNRASNEKMKVFLVHFVNFIIYNLNFINLIKFTGICFCFGSISDSHQCFYYKQCFHKKNYLDSEVGDQFPHRFKLNKIFRPSTKFSQLSSFNCLNAETKHRFEASKSPFYSLVYNFKYLITENFNKFVPENA